MENFMLTIILSIAVAFIFYKIGIFVVLLMALSIAVKISLAVIFALSSLLTWHWWRYLKGSCQWRSL